MKRQNLSTIQNKMLCTTDVQSLSLTHFSCREKATWREISCQDISYNFMKTAIMYQLPL